MGEFFEKKLDLSELFAEMFSADELIEKLQAQIDELKEMKNCVIREPLYGEWMEGDDEDDPDALTWYPDCGEDDPDWGPLVKFITNNSEFAEKHGFAPMEFDPDDEWDALMMKDLDKRFAKLTAGDTTT